MRTFVHGVLFIAAILLTAGLVVRCETFILHGGT